MRPLFLLLLLDFWSGITEVEDLLLQVCITGIILSGIFYLQQEVEVLQQAGIPTEAILDHFPEPPLHCQLEPQHLMILFLK